MLTKGTISFVASLVVVAVAIGVSVAYSNRGSVPKDTNITEIRPKESDSSLLSTERPNVIVTEGADTSETDRPFDHVVTFPDGEQYQVRMRPGPKHVIKYPDVLIDEYDSLRLSAENGHPESAFVLHRALEQCREQAYADEQELAEALETLRQTHIVVWPNGRKARISDPTDVEGYESALTQPFKLCQGISAAQKAESNGWLEKAAKRGYRGAMMRLGEIHGNSEKALEVMQEAWLNGHVLAVLKLADLHRMGWSDGEKLNRDDVAAYAHLYLYAQLMEPALGGSGDLMASIHAEKRRELQLSAERLQPHELEQALEQAKAILKSNENCCYTTM